MSKHYKFEEPRLILISAELAHTHPNIALEIQRVCCHMHAVVVKCYFFLVAQRLKQIGCFTYLKEANTGSKGEETELTAPVVM